MARELPALVRNGRSPAIADRAMGIDVASRQSTLILYVEDDALTRRSVGQRLVRRGYQVLQAESGEQALELVRSGTTPAAALLDLELPGMDGAETIRRLRQYSPALPAVVCSANLTPAARHELDVLGVPAECILAKPCAFQQILAALERASAP